MRQRKPIRKLGKIGKLRQRVRAAWVKDHPPNHEGYYECYLCRKWVHWTEMELDHVLPKSGTSLEVSVDHNNLKPTHILCNRLKGSKRL